MPRFLVSRLSALGDVVCTLPVASALKSIPESHVTWIVDPRFAGIVECCPAVDEVRIWKPKVTPKDLPTFEEPFEAAFDMQGLLKSALAISRAKAKRKFGYHWQREGSRFFSERVLPDPSSAHVVDQYLDVVRLGAEIEVDAAHFALQPKPEDVEAMRELLAENGIFEGEKFLVVNAGAGWASKRWQPASFAQVIDQVAERGVHSVLIGGKAEGDRAAAAEVIQASKRPPADLLGKTSVRQLVALVSLARAHLGGDTGSSHLATALGVPAVSLYSITRPQRSCPYGQVDRCHYDPRGLSHIAPEPVVESLMEVLG